MRIRWSSLLTLCLGIFLGAAARADTLDEAKAAFAAGKQAFERGEYETALSQFQRANLLAPAPSLSYNIGKTYEELGRYRDAALAYERYLELEGAPQTDQEKQFQVNLKARIEADRARPDRTETTAPNKSPQVNQPHQPPPVPPPSYAPPYATPYYAPSYPVAYPPAYANPYVVAPKPLTREARLEQLKGQHGRAIALIVVGGAVFLGGIVLIADGATTPHGGACLGTLDEFGACPVAANGYNVAELFFGATFGVVGTTLWAPGISSLVKSSREIVQLSRPEAEPAQRGIKPQTFLFNSPVFRF